MVPLTTGTLIMAITALFVTIGTFMADYNETHIKNPRWPPHAKFHNGQTMTLSIVTTLLTLYYLFRPIPLSRNSPPSTIQAVRRNDLFTAALIGSIYCATALSGILYPGTAGTDPEFGEGFPQKWLFSGLITLNWVGWWLA
ncbi:hypothetical protein CNMCM8694_005574 [Aspergillus lentulus]|nr:hypothetical protein CNMCM8060_009747 [Aspergillus lentulus]KAF4187703.1 hypothetical protein CNMCM7927_003649 [Aspergillus lentulus]KAF4195980.1 hypothetical protein CNMCM8694_005574 [Aspergillus lentulus]